MAIFEPKSGVSLGAAFSPNSYYLLHNNKNRCEGTYTREAVETREASLACDAKNHDTTTQIYGMFIAAMQQSRREK